jgi:hypothetical protein
MAKTWRRAIKIMGLWGPFHLKRPLIVVFSKRVFCRKNATFNVYVSLKHFNKVVIHILVFFRTIIIISFCWQQTTVHNSL